MNKKQEESIIDPKDVEDSLNGSPITASEQLDHELSVLPDDYFSNNANVGLEDMTAEDIPTPVLTLIQSTSRVRDEENRPYTPGMFYYKTTKSAAKELHVSILVATKQMLKSFNDDSATERVYILLGAIMPKYLPFKMFLRGYGAGAARQFIGEVKALRRPMYSLNVKLHSVQKENDKGVFYVPQFSIEGLRTSREEIVNLEELARTYSENTEKIKQETEAELTQTAEPRPF